MTRKDVAKARKLHSRAMQRFAVAIGATNSIESLAAGILGALVVTLDEMTPEQINEMELLIDKDSVRALR